MARIVTFLKAIGVLLAVLICVDAEAKNCTKGKPCGATCIELSDTCHVGTSPTPPLCSLFASPMSVSAGNSVSLSSSCFPAASSYSWTNTGFGSSQSSGTVTPTKTTTYSVVGSNTDGAGNAASVTVTVTAPLPVPTCTLTASPTSIVAGGSSLLIANCPGATNYVWTNTGLGSTSTSATVRPTSTTTYTVRASNASGFGNTASVTVTVAAPVLTAPTCTLAASPESIVAGGSSTLTAYCSPDATSYSWTNAGLSSTASSGTVRPSATTTYSVRASNAMGTGNTASATITVSAAPGSCSGGMSWNGSACACPIGQSLVDGQCFGPLPASSCGIERWAIKTGADPDAALVNQKAAVPSTVAVLGTLTTPASLSATARSSPVESTVYVVDATLTRYSMTDDSDYHLILSAGGRSMIAKLPHPDCVDAESVFKSSLITARAAFNAQLRTTRAFKTTSIPVRIVGVGFFDQSTGQAGAAPNRIELHPVLKIEFNPATPQGSDPAYTLVSEADRLFNWAEVAYPDLFSKPGTAGIYQQYTYRFYAKTGNYIATDPGGRVMVHNGRDWVLLDVGSLTDLMPAVTKAGY